MSYFAQKLHRHFLIRIFDNETGRRFQNNAKYIIPTFKASIEGFL